MDKKFAMPGTWLKCISTGCGHQADLLEERNFKCPECGNLYDVEHEYEKVSFRTFTDRFDTRARTSFIGLGQSLVDCEKISCFPELRSGVWRFKEWIMPHLPSEKIVTLGEGNMPIVRAGGHLAKWLGAVDAWVIMEGTNPTGSFKDNGMTVKTSIEAAARVTDDACASTGDTSASNSAYSSSVGIRCSVFVPQGKITPVQFAQLEGAKVIALPGSFDDCMRVVKDLVDEGKVYPSNSLNPTRIEGHQVTVFLIAQFFGWELPDWIALPVGNGSNCSSVGKAMRLMKQLGFKEKTPQILGCQSEAACPLSRSWIKTAAVHPNVSIERWLNNYQPMKVGETVATAARIGNPVSRDKVMREIVASQGKMNIASEKLLKEAVSVAGKDGLSVCPQTGTALAGVKLAVANGSIRRGSSVVIVSTATGLKFTDSMAEGIMKRVINAKDCKTSTAARILGL